MEKLYFQLPGKIFFSFSMKTKRRVSRVVWTEEEVSVPAGACSALLTGLLSWAGLSVFL